MSETVPETVSEPSSSGVVDTAGQDEAWKVLDGLTEPERRFVNAAISGKDWPECADAGGWTTLESVARVLGRPRVKIALETIAPLLGALDPKRATKLLRPYMLAKLARTALNASDAQSTQAIKEILAVDGISRRDDARIAAGLMDVLGAVERRLSARTVDAEVVKVPELPASVSDSESPGTTPIGIATIPDAADGVPARVPATGAAKRPGRRGRRGTKPSP